MNITPVSSVGYNTYFCGKAYNNHKPDKTVDYAQVEKLSKKGQKLVHRLDNRTNLMTKEIEAIGEEADKLKSEFTPELYFKVKEKNEGKTDSDLPKGYLFEGSCNKVLKTDFNNFGIVIQKVAKYKDDGKLDNVIVRKQRMGDGYDAIFDEERYEFSGKGKLKRYTISANAATKEGYNCEKRTFDFTEYSENGDYDNYQYSSYTGERSENKKASSVIFYNGKLPTHVDVVSHSYCNENGTEQKIGKTQIDGTMYAHVFEEMGKDRYYEAASLRESE